ncbi:MAG: endonuclease III [Candidatus Aenigmatarchaeota archaeon]|nr:MAG: endonuclease III [Candidatus Aenigmarchaeota archaeon]
MVDFLVRRYGDVQNLAANKEDPFSVIISCILSQRTRDEQTERAFSALVAVASTPQEILALPRARLERLIRVSGPYKQKAKKIHETCRQIMEEFGGRVPRTRHELMTLYGIGPKCADIVLMYGHGIPSIAIDTHCNRVPKRIGLIDEEASVEDVKRVLENNIPKSKWHLINTDLIKFGRDLCRPVGPKCSICPLSKICKYYKEGYSKRI